MNKFTNLFILAVLSVVVTPTAIFADYQIGSTPGSNSMSRQAQISSNQVQGYNDPYRSDKSAENSAIRQDRGMSREDYDSHEGFYPSNQHLYGQQNRSHEQMMYGEGTYSNQGGEYHPRGYSNFQQSQLNANVQHPTYEYRLGKDGKWYDTKEDNSQVSHQIPGQAMPASYSLNENYLSAPRNDNQSIPRNVSNSRNNPTLYNQQNSYDSYQEISDNSETQPSYSTSRTNSVNTTTTGKEGDIDRKNSDSSTTTTNTFTTKKSNAQR